MIPSNQSWISSSNVGWCSSRIDIGLFEIRHCCFFWLTRLVGRPFSILPWCLKNNHSPWGRLCDWSLRLPHMVSLSNLWVWPLLDDRLMAILKLDIDIYNIGIKVSKCNLVNLLESLSCGNNSFRSKSTVWMISNTSLSIASPFVYTWSSNQLKHCVNSSITWWPQTFNHVNSSRLAFQRCVPSWYQNQFHSMASLSHFVG
jgi:hypothetical protein